MKVKTKIIILLITYCVFSQNYNDLSVFDSAIKEKQRTDSIVEFRMTDTEDDTIDYSGDEITDSIYISSDDPKYRTILACEYLIDSINSFVSQSKQGKELLSYDINNQKLFMEYLLRYHIIDTVTVKSYAKSILNIIKLNIKKHKSILATQEGNSRAIVFKHIKILRIKINTINSYVNYLEK